MPIFMKDEDAYKLKDGDKLRLATLEELKTVSSFKNEANMEINVYPNDPSINSRMMKHLGKQVTYKSLLHRCIYIYEDKFIYDMRWFVKSSSKHRHRWRKPNG